MPDGQPNPWDAAIVEQMTAVCVRYGAEFVPPSPNSKAGVAANLTADAFPVNGLRHAEGSTSGWFLWAGNELPSDPDFFQPLHVRHLLNRCPGVLPYIGLAPGWRFILAPGHEDVWYDGALLRDEV